MRTQRKCGRWFEQPLLTVTSERLFISLSRDTIGLNGFLRLIMWALNKAERERS